jgi:RNA polymerase sigma factor (sigma-70 family)
LEPQACRALDVLEAIGPQIANLLGRLTLRKDVAQELMQDLFLRLHRSKGFAAAGNPQGYAYRAAVRLGLDWRRSRKGRPDPVALKVDPPGRDQSVLNQLIQAEETERVLDAISQLDEPYRSACVMRWVQQMEYEAIASHLGKTPHQVRGLCHWALRQLREQLAGKPEGSDGKEDCHVER